MTQRDSPTINVNLLRSDAHDLLRRPDDDAESLVEFKEIHLILFDPCQGEGFGDG